MHRVECLCSFVRRWLDKLGVAARMGIDVVVRQSFFRGHYALLDNDMQPRPVCQLHLLHTCNVCFSSERMCVAIDIAIGLLYPLALYFCWTPCRGVKYCDDHVCTSICLFVFLSVCSHISKNLKTAHPNLNEFVVHVVCGHDSVLIWQQCICYVLRFRDWHCVFIWWRDYGWIKDNTCVSFSSPGISTGGEVCRFRLHRVRVCDALFWASAIKLRFEITCIQVCLILVILYGFLFTYFPLLFMLSLDWCPHNYFVPRIFV